MVYCNFIEKTDEKIKYSIGGTVNDITGELEIKPDLSWKITKQPQNSKVCILHIEWMLGRHIQEFKKKSYPKKMAYEI